MQGDLHETTSKTLATVWAWLPQIAAGVATLASFAGTLINIFESKTVARWRHRRALAREASSDL